MLGSCGSCPHRAVRLGTGCPVLACPRVCTCTLTLSMCYYHRACTCLSREGVSCLRVVNMSPCYFYHHGARDTGQVGRCLTRCPTSAPAGDQAIPPCPFCTLWLTDSFQHNTKLSPASPIASATPKGNFMPYSMAPPAPH